MKTPITLFLIFVLLLTTSCKEELQYQYTDQEDILNCNFKDKALIKEAFYAFEDYLRDNYKYKHRNSRGVIYANYWSIMTSETPPKTDNINEHVKSILNKLLETEDLFVTKNGQYILNQSSDIIKCIAKEMKDEDLKTTFNALLTTNTLEPNLFVPAIRRNTKLITKDNALATYVALQQFYGLLASMDLTITDLERFKRRRDKLTHDNHDGHNH